LGHSGGGFQTKTNRFPGGARLAGGPPSVHSGFRPRLVRRVGGALGEHVGPAAWKGGTWGGFFRAWVASPRSNGRGPGRGSGHAALSVGASLWPGRRGRGGPTRGKGGPKVLYPYNNARFWARALDLSRKLGGLGRGVARTAHILFRGGYVGEAGPRGDPPRLGEVLPNLQGQLYPVGGGGENLGARPLPVGTKGPAFSKDKRGRRSNSGNFPIAGLPFGPWPVGVTGAAGGASPKQTASSGVWGESLFLLFLGFGTRVAVLRIPPFAENNWAAPPKAREKKTAMKKKKQCMGTIGWAAVVSTFHKIFPFFSFSLASHHQSLTLRKVSGSRFCGKRMPGPAVKNQFRGAKKT